MTLNRRDFDLLKEALAKDGSLDSLGLALSFFQVTDESSDGDTSGSKSTQGVPVNSELTTAPTPATSPVSPTLAENLSLLRSTLSSLVSDSIQSLMDASAQIANQPVTVGTIMGGSVDMPFLRYSGSGGTVLSYNPASDDYSIANYQTGTSSLTTLKLRGGRMASSSAS
jgi:hypothetical protein